MGILTIAKTITGNLFSRPPTSRYPAEPAKRYELTRGHLAFEPAGCRVCRVCMLRCPTQAIVVDREKRTWECDHFRCITCGNCVACPTNALRLEPVYRSPEADRPGKEFHEIPGPAAEGRGRRRGGRGVTGVPLRSLLFRKSAPEISGPPIIRCAGQTGPSSRRA